MRITQKERVRRYMGKRDDWQGRLLDLGFLNEDGSGSQPTDDTHSRPARGVRRQLVNGIAKRNGEESRRLAESSLFCDDVPQGLFPTNRSP